MNEVSPIINSILNTYGIIGIVLAAVILVLFTILLILLFYIYWRVASFRLMRKSQLREKEPAVSIIVPLFAEDSNYLDTSLVTLLTQDYSEPFEVVLVYVGNSNDFFDDVKTLQRLYPNLSPVHIDCSPYYPVSQKIALNVGIKSAKYDYIITSSSDATPTSERWLGLLAKGFLYGDIVLGYSGMAKGAGFKNYIFRIHRFATSMHWLSSAIRQKSYAGSRNALGFTKKLYFDARGYNFLNMNVGEDDLFLQKIATADNVSVVLSPRATCDETIWGSWSWWWPRELELHSTHQHYPKMTTTLYSTELTLRLLFFVAILAALIFMPWPFKIAALVLAVVRYLLVLFVLARNALRLGEKGLMGRYFIYDIIEPILRFAISTSSGQKRKQPWE